MQDWRGIGSAAALVFFAGTAGAWGVAGDLGLFCRKRIRQFLIRQDFAVFFRELFVAIEIFPEGIDVGLTERRCGLVMHAFDDCTPVAKAKIGAAGFAAEVFAAVLAFSVEFAQLGDAAVEKAMGLSAGAIHGQLGVGSGFVLQRVERERSAGFNHGSFDFTAAAEAPHGATDFIDEVVLETAFGLELGAEGLVESIVFGLLAGADEVFRGEEAVFGGIARGRGFAGLGAGSGGVLGVGGIGCQFCG